MNKWQSDVMEFHRAFCPEQIAEMPTLPDHNVRTLRYRLIHEELTELINGFASRDIVEVTDALFDLLVVTLGTAVACGIDMDEVWVEGHRSNMSKAGGTRRADGKVGKGPNYSPPDFARVLAAQQPIAVEPA